MPDSDLPDVRDKSDAELEHLVIWQVMSPKPAAAARAELNRRQREHDKELVDRQLKAAADVAKATKWAMIAAWASAIGALLSAVGTLIQAFR